MISRRRFLQTSTVSAAAISSIAAADEIPANCKPLPPAIAQLPSLKEQVKPITVQERIDRQDKARRLMQANHLDAILLMSGTSLRYFTGIQWWGSERTFAFVLPASGKTFFVCPAFEQARALEQIANSPQAGVADIRTWQEDESPYEKLAQGLRDHGIATGTLGIEETVKFVFSNSLSHAAPQIKFASASPVTAGCRMIKSPRELALMRLACKVTLTVYEAVFKSLHEGMTDSDIRQLVQSAYAKVGFEGDVDVSIATSSSSPHGSTEAQVVREGSIIMLDDGCTADGYWSDITRTFVLGDPSDKMKTVFDVVHRAQSAALRAARPGVPCESVDAAARKVITDAGYGPDYKYFTHRLGHGMGMDGHEWPYLVRENKTPLEPDMVFSDEPGIYIPSEFGIRLEDDMHITENGAELFTPQSPSLTQPFGSGRLS
ncbi:MAG TPA: Xaa-Pro peptidase family protein [Terriglobales bacterium]|nr:Xaa-Pro peptidase family protein [Terriglobales bacterium]